MYSKRREETAKFVIQDKLKKDFWARFYGLLVYKQKKDKISEEEVKNLQQGLEQQGLVTRAESSDKKHYLLRICVMIPHFHSTSSSARSVVLV